MFQPDSGHPYERACIRSPLRIYLSIIFCNVTGGAFYLNWKLTELLKNNKSPAAPLELQIYKSMPQSVLISWDSPLKSATWFSNYVFLSRPKTAKLRYPPLRVRSLTSLQESVRHNLGKRDTPWDCSRTPWCAWRGCPAWRRRCSRAPHYHSVCPVGPAGSAVFCDIKRDKICRGTLRELTSRQVIIDVVVIP